MAYIQGTTGNDLIIGTNENDVLDGLGGIDTINGGNGDDRLIAFMGIVDGASGNDTLVADYSNYTVEGITNEASRVRRSSNSGINFTLLSYANIENYQITGTRFNDNLTGFAGRDTLNGGLGNDTISGGLGDSLNGGEGIDLLNLNLSTFTGNSVLNINPSNSQLQAVSSTHVSGFEELGAITLGSGNDSLTWDRVVPNTALNLGAGNDTINLSLNAGNSTARVDGDSGNDTLILNYSNYTVEGITNEASRVRRSSNSGINFTLLSYANIENYQITGTRFNDNLTGFAGQDTLNGGLGNDTLNLGNDNVSDTVRYALGDGIDTVNQFVKGIDKLSLINIPFVDVVTSGGDTLLRLGNGNASGFGNGDLLLTLKGVTGFTSKELGLGGSSLDPSNQAQFFFS
jgi:Ca2+-binding RTX toxin-like protein